ncbi:uncharacterized protein PHACADRAFT_182579 [Phanerochaete carnosa HHB-10118-sp]|uniref:CS domain-containing protein n=1 Tax=Phanerochaete carnosa (strain HHB-10118-sp) TaxID=650164 RepID=K5V680_PHACS|nr:uncharacterized protein PHACADRAFT_182579 [Phanerochaete carnosa HHB-10118-sp]EKM58211.1 hypothetical protein PHACADRAFT_182579 [Phanerochaete carnosa HHB-10118-sp]
MDRAHESFLPYSWHQSHDQATVLLYVPYETEGDDVEVKFERNYLVAGVKRQPAVVKGRLYGSIDVAHSSWQLEPRASSRLSARERTTSTTSTTSTQSSFALISEPEISSSFAASLEEGFLSDLEDTLSSPALSSPVSLSSAEEATGFPLRSPPPRRRSHFTTSHPVSPRMPSNRASSMVSSASSVESLRSGASRLLTIHLEKADSMIWPSLVIGPVSEAISPPDTSRYPWAPSGPTEACFNMDPTSLVLLGLDHFDIREDREEAFEYFVRAWHQTHISSATIRLATHYLPPHAVPPEQLHTPRDALSTPTSSSGTHPPSPDTTPVASAASVSYTEQTISAFRGTLPYYLERIGGSEKLAQLYLEAGLLHLEGSASGLLSSSYAGLSSLRTPTLTTHPALHVASHAGMHHDGPEAWSQDQAHARRLFNRARELNPALDVPLLPTSNPSSEPDSGDNVSPVFDDTLKLKMPAVNVQGSSDEKPRRRRKREAEDPLAASITSKSAMEDPLDRQGEDNTWYLYLPGLVGAGTALLVVGFLSFSSWRKGQGT